MLVPLDLCARSVVRIFVCAVGLGSAAPSHICPSALPRVRYPYEFSISVPVQCYGWGELESLQKGCFVGLRRSHPREQFSRNENFVWLGTRAHRESVEDMFDMPICQLEHAGKDCDGVLR